MSEEIRRHRRHRAPAASRRHFSDGNPCMLLRCRREDQRRIRNDSRCALLDSPADVAIAVGRLPLHRKEERAGTDPSRVVLDPPNRGSVLRVRTGSAHHFGSAQDFFKAHIKLIVSVDSNAQRPW